MLRAKRVKAFSRSSGVTWYLHPFPSTVTWIKSPVSITVYWDESNDDAKPILEFSSIWMIPVSKPSPSEDASAKWGDITSDFLPLSTKYTQEQSQNNNLYHLTAPVIYEKLSLNR